ncbi:unnamed protein product, partial [Musa acuminata subsp. burmannicoides]
PNPSTFPPCPLSVSFCAPVFFLSSQLHHVSNIEAQSPAFSYSHSFFFFPKRSCHNRRRCRCHNRSPFHRTTFLPPFSRRHNCC